ncbi:hypothetical protein BO83DRAFT_451288 [Aspergillus eucalypticola CBS 122712]|uniref:Uncharacterized protein n=1 Tax=Aspergillus eucalypticola (strain CBS 122712 / IBT 29274) TaxID=1448314 RepID=A0A317UXX7_ASPEC|nr:uncharacterized protein BO83DRAFT_451288 [Aspergillus eucalypticola CBS 122712]PWY66903.1 hypothetical protein BO83DRAFT_451288 [Aspergillus eucalypticola CBS 122712]
MAPSMLPTSPPTMPIFVNPSSTATVAIMATSLSSHTAVAAARMAARTAATTARDLAVGWYLTSDWWYRYGCGHCTLFPSSYSTYGVVE